MRLFAAESVLIMTLRDKTRSPQGIRPDIVCCDERAEAVRYREADDGVSDGAKSLVSRML